MAETIAVIAAVLFTAAGIFAALTVILWFLFGIPAVIRDLSGGSKSARSRIEITMLEEIICIHTDEDIRGI